MTWDEIEHKYRNATKIIYIEFYKDIEEYFKDKMDHDIFSRMYSYCWDQGHSAGYHEVLMHLNDVQYLITGKFLE